MIARLLIALSLLLPATPSLAAVPIPAPPQVAGKGHLLVDMHSGKVLAEQNADERLAPASLTKIMTAYVVFRELAAGNVHLDDEVLVSDKAWRMPGSRMFIEVNKRVKLEDLLKGLIIQSGNDASVALAEHVAGSEDTFAQLMNNHSARLGLTNSHFMNATGLPHEDHYITAADIAKVAEATIREFPDYYKWYAEKSFKFNKINQHNRNKLLWRDKSVDGVKTGHTESAGYCLVASAEKEGMRLVSVIMGTDSEEARARETQKLLNYGFRFFETHRLYGAGDQLTEVRVWQGDKEQLPLGVSEDLYVTIPRHQYDNLEARMDIDQPVVAPVQKGQQLGRVIVELDGEKVVDIPLIALAEIPEGGIWDRMVDSVLLMME